jgi:hypothetical protein
MMTMQNGRFYLPSRNRPKSLERFFQAYRDTGATCPGWVVLNADDWEKNRTAYEALMLPTGWSCSLANQEPSAATKTPEPVWHALLAAFRGNKSASAPGKVDSMCGAMRAMWPTMKDLAWVGWADDDYLPETPGWDVKMVEGLRGYNFVSTNDCWKSRADITVGRMCGAWAFSGDLLRAVGYLVPPGLKKSYVDDVWEIIGRATGTWETRMDIVVRHLHPETGLAVADATNAQVNKHWRNDTKIITRWRKTAAGPAIERVKTILPQAG